MSVPFTAVMVAYREQLTPQQTDDRYRPHLELWKPAIGPVTNDEGLFGLAEWYKAGVEATRNGWVPRSPYGVAASYWQGAEAVQWRNDNPPENDPPLERAPGT